MTKEGFSRRVDLILICTTGASRESRGLVRVSGRKVKGEEGGTAEPGSRSQGDGQGKGVRRASEQISEGRYLTNVPYYPTILGPLFPISVWRL